MERENDINKDSINVRGNKKQPMRHTGSKNILFGGPTSIVSDLIIGINCMGVASGGGDPNIMHVKGKNGNAKVSNIKVSGTRTDSLVTCGKTIFKSKVNGASRENKAIMKGKEKK